MANEEAFQTTQSERVLATLQKMGRKSRLLASTLARRLMEQLELDGLSVAEALRDLHRAGRIRYTPDSRGQPLSGYVDVAVTEAVVPAHCISWQSALSNAGFSSDAVGVLLGLFPKLEDMGEHDMTVLALALKNLSDLVRTDPAISDDAGFNVSARRVMGGSKVLSMLTEKMALALGLPLRLHQSSPRYLIFAGPPNSSATLLIENPRAFENAVRAGLAQSMALVCTYGFGISYIGQERLHATQTKVDDAPIILARQGIAPTFRDLFAAETLMFWGDLDVAGLAIYRALASSLPTLQLSGIYHAMTNMLTDPKTSHPYCSLFDKAGQAALTRSLSDSAVSSPAHQLFRQCISRAVDQEAVSEDEIIKYGTQAFWIL
jgi:hypothetical protein